MLRDDRFALDADHVRVVAVLGNASTEQLEPANLCALRQQIGSALAAGSM